MEERKVVKRVLSKKLRYNNVITLQRRVQGKQNAI